CSTCVSPRNDARHQQWATIAPGCQGSAAERERTTDERLLRPAAFVFARQASATDEARRQQAEELHSLRRTPDRHPLGTEVASPTMGGVHLRMVLASEWRRYRRLQREETE